MEPFRTMPRDRVVNAVWPRGTPLHWRTPSASIGSHPHGKRFISLSVCSGKASKSSVGWSLLLGLRIFNWSPGVTYCVHGLRSDRTIKSSKLATIRSQQSNPLAVLIAHSPQPRDCSDQTTVAEFVAPHLSNPDTTGRDFMIINGVLQWLDHH